MPMEKTLSAFAPKIQKIYKHILCQLLQPMVQLYSNAKTNALTNVVNITRETKRLALMLYLEEQLVSILPCQRNLITSVIILHEMETSAAMKELVERDWKLKEEVSFAVSLP
ncbi:Baculoviral IAP repeat-containing protein [Trichinella pseudospiralis]